MDRRPDRPKEYRLIAPRHVDLQTTQISQPSNADDGKTKRASMACLECKKRRTKCTTGHPCSECATHDRECIYDQSQDKRRKEHSAHTKTQLQNTAEQLQSTETSLGYYHKLLEDLLQSVRLASNDQLDELVQVIQGTRKNDMPEDKNAYVSIIDTVKSIIEESDAPGSDVESDQDIIP